MKNFIQRSLATVGTAAFLAINALTPAHAGFTFEETEVNQDDVIAIAQPLKTKGYQGYKLLVLEQKSDRRACWSEVGGNVGPVAVDPLLLGFDFTGICGRATDSNGYSARVNDTDLALTHNLSLQEIGGEVKLFAVSSGEKILIGSTEGVSEGFLKVNLKPGWRFTKRTYGDKVLGHFYISNDNYIASDVVDDIEDDLDLDGNGDDGDLDLDLDGSGDDMADGSDDGADDLADGSDDGGDDLADGSDDGGDDLADGSDDGADDLADGSDDGSDDLADGSDDGADDLADCSDDGGDDIVQLPEDEEEEEEEGNVIDRSDLQAWKRYIEMLLKGQ